MFLVISSLLLASLAHAAPAPQVVSSLTSEAGSAIASATSGAGSVASSATSDVASAAASISSAAAAEFSSVYASAVLDLPLPTSIAGVVGNSNASKPVDALLVPSYSNFTSQGWNVRFNAFIYQEPDLSDSELAQLVDLLHIDNSTLNATERTLLLNRTTELASIPQPNYPGLNVTVVYNGQNITSMPIMLQQADLSGEIDQFMVVPGLANATGNSTQLKNTTTVQLFAQGIAGPGNSTTILVPESGYSVVSDIDDVLRVTKVYVPTTGLKNSFAEPYVNYASTPEVFAEWERTLPSVAFHYDTTTPVQLTRTYVDYLFSNYPLGSLEMRPINITEPSSILDARGQSLQRLFQSFPMRKFVLVGDTSSSTLLKAYPQIAQQYPQQLACIFIRNTSATDGDDKLPYNTADFKNVNSSQYFFYVQPDDLFGIDIAGGQCINQTIPQNVTFGEQGGPFNR